MYNIGALVRLGKLTTQTVQVESPARFRTVEACILQCEGCRATSRRGSVELDVVRHGLALVARSSTKVLFAGADPLTSSELAASVTAARELGLDVEVLTPGILLTPRRAAELVEAGVGRMRISIDQNREGFIDSLRGAGEAHRAGLPVDLHVTVAPEGAPLIQRLYCSLGALPVDRIIVADDGCMTPTLPVGPSVAREAATSAVRAMLTDDGKGVPVFLEGPAFDARLVLDVVEDVVGARAARRARRLLTGMPLKAVGAGA